MNSLRRALLLLFYVTACSLGKTLDNRLIGTPTVSCGPSLLTISAESSDVFEGQVFIKSHRSASSDCLALFSSSMNITSPSFSLPLSRIASCGLEMVETKSLRLSTVIVFGFHQTFVTAGDRAFAVHCLFQQKDVRVDTQIDSIHDIQPKHLSGVSFEIPVVEMKIVSGRDDSTNAPEQVEVGSPIMLVWKLSNPSEMFGIRVLDCTASDSEGQGQEVLSDGCATDDHLLSHVQYSAGDARAFSEVTAFKMPDEEQLFFRCRVAFCLKKSPRILASNVVAESAFCQPSKCDEPRFRREVALSDQPVVIVGRGVNVSEPLALAPQPLSVSAESFSSVCLSSGLFAITASFSATIYTIAAATGILLMYQRIRRKKSFSF